MNESWSTLNNHEANMVQAALRIRPVQIDRLHAAGFSTSSFWQNLTAFDRGIASFHRTVAVALLGAASCAGVLMRIYTFFEKTLQILKSGDQPWSA